MLRPNSFLAAPMRAREQSHRRFVLWGIGALLLLSLSPVLGHHVLTGLDAALVGHDHLLHVCLIALHTLLAPVHGVFHVLLAAGVLYATYDRVRAIARLRQIISLIGTNTGSTSPAFVAAVRESGLDVAAVRRVERLPNPAFTAGWWTPKVYVAGEIEHVLSHAELVAVLMHEGEHVRRRDPLRLSLLRFLGCTLFWIPAFRRLAADMSDESEIAADDVAARDQPLVLASAILALAAWRAPRESTGATGTFLPNATATFVVNASQRSASHDALLERRIRRLAGETTVVASHLTRRSLLGAVAMLGAVWISGVIVSHPMPAESLHAHLAHCDHPGEGALSHLFCRSGLFQRPSQSTEVLPSAESANGGARSCPHSHSAA